MKNCALTHDYGILHSNNIPSPICIERRNLGQNASQQKCLLHNIPFILYQHKDHPKLIEKWPCVISIFKIVRIAYSAKINESNLFALESSVSAHMEAMIECFPAENLLLKHHYMLHYANIIRAVGPVVHMSTMRFETMHKKFTDVQRRSNNFINVSGSLASNYQKSKLFDTPYQSQISTGKLRTLPDNWTDRYDNVLEETFKRVDQVFFTKWLRINNNYYRKGLILKTNDSSFCEIDEILFKNTDYFFLCHKLQHAGFDEFLFSLIIQEKNPINRFIVKEKNLGVKKSFSKKNVKGRFYIIADCLHIPIE